MCVCEREREREIEREKEAWEKGSRRILLLRFDWNAQTNQQP